MIPVDQEFLHDPTNGINGDCLRACIASILETSIENIPHFLRSGSAKDCNNELNLFLAERGLFLLDVEYSGAKAILDANILIGHACYHLIAGPSPRHKDLYHSVVGRNGDIIHDPHPSRDNLGGTHKDWVISFFVSLYPNTWYNKDSNLVFPIGEINLVPEIQTIILNNPNTTC